MLERERVGYGEQREATSPIKYLVKQQHLFLSFRWNTCLRQNCSLGFSACSEGLAFGQNALMMMMILGIYIKIQCPAYLASNWLVCSWLLLHSMLHSRDSNNGQSHVLATCNLCDQVSCKSHVLPKWNITLNSEFSLLKHTF